MSIAEYTLAHHGIKGQKWGVRRFQNADGTLTNRGRKRYNKAVYKEVVNRTALGRPVVKGKLISEIVDELKPSYDRFNKSKKQFDAETAKVQKTEWFKKEFAVAQKKIKANYDEEEIDGKTYMVAKNKFKGKRVVIEKKNFYENVKNLIVDTMDNKPEGLKKAEKTYYEEVSRCAGDLVLAVNNAVGKYENKAITKKQNLSRYVIDKVDDYLQSKKMTYPTDEEMLTAKKHVKSLNEYDEIYFDVDENKK